MNLDPTVSPWIGIFASTGVCLWMVAIGAPLARAVFGDRPRPVWPFYAPALGIVAVLLTTNLSAYVIPGAPSAWFGLLVPSALAAFAAWRDRRIRLPSLRTALASLTLLLASIGTYVLAFSSRTQVRPGEEAWHYALALRMARGDFPPVTPYGQDAGIGYHYGPDLLAASIVNTAGVPPWTAVAVLTALLVVGVSSGGCRIRLGCWRAVAPGRRGRCGAGSDRPTRPCGAAPLRRDIRRCRRPSRVSRRVGARSRGSTVRVGAQAPLGTRSVHRASRGRGPRSRHRSQAGGPDRCRCGCHGAGGGSGARVRKHRAWRGGRQSSFPARRPPATSSGKRARHCRPAGRAWRRARVRYALSARWHDGHGSDRI